MTDEALVRIYLPSYNRRELLVEALRSVERQTYRNWYLHLFDDASTDGAADVCADFARRHPDRVEAVCLARNRGLNWTLNRFLADCRAGEVLAFFAHDDVWKPDRLAIGLVALSSSPHVALSYSDSELIDDSGAPLGRRFSDNWGPPPADDLFADTLFERGNFVCGPTVLARADAFRELRLTIPPQVRLSTDYYMWLVLASHYDVRFVDSPLSFYRVSPTQLTNRFRQTQREDFLIPQLAYRRCAPLRRKIPGREARALFAGKARMYLHRRQLEGDVGDAAWYGARLLGLEPTGHSLMTAARAVRGAQLARARSIA